MVESHSAKWLNPVMPFRFPAGRNCLGMGGGLLQLSRGAMQAPSTSPHGPIKQIGRIGRERRPTAILFCFYLAVTTGLRLSAPLRILAFL